MVTRDDGSAQERWEMAPDAGLPRAQQHVYIDPLAFALHTRNVSTMRWQGLDHGV